MRNEWKLLLALLLAAFPLSAQSAPSSANTLPEPRQVTFCELAKDPAAYNKKVVRLTTFVTHGFEDFHLGEPNCPALSHHFSIWVMYGGKVESNTAYCCPGETGEKTRSKSVTIERIPIPLLEDSTFNQFKDLLEKEHNTVVRATVVGRFFSGVKRTFGKSILWTGYGHMGCCSLLAIQRVEEFEPHTRNDVDYTAEAGWWEKEGCDAISVQYLRHVSIIYGEGMAEEAIAEQRMADSGERAWALTDPERVAVESLNLFTRIKSRFCSAWGRPRCGKCSSGGTGRSL